METYSTIRKNKVGVIGSVILLCLLVVGGYFYYQNVERNTNYLFVTDVVHALIDIKASRSDQSTTPSSAAISTLEWAYGTQEQLSEANNLMQPWSTSGNQNIKDAANQILLSISDIQDGTNAIIRVESGEYPSASNNDIALATVKLKAGRGGLTDDAMYISTHNFDMSQSQKNNIVAYINNNFADDIKIVHDNAMASSTNYSLPQESWAALIISAGLTLSSK